MRIIDREFGFASQLADQLWAEGDYAEAWALRAELASPALELANDDGELEFAGAYGSFMELSNSAVDLANARYAEDEAAAARPRMAAEDRLASALDRIANGTYTPQGQYAVGLANEHASTAR